MKNTKCKKALADFFTKRWSSEEMKAFVGNQQNFFNFRDRQSYQVVDDQVQSRSVEDFGSTSHEEAGTKII